MIQIEQKVKEIIQLYKEMTGRNVIPKNTDPTRTYQWRYVIKFLKNMENVPWEITKKVARYAIQYAKENKGNTVWSRGLWVLTKSNIIDIAYNRCQKQNESIASIFRRLQQSYDFAKDHNFNLAARPPGGLPNIVAWFEKKKINIAYLALSESCRKAMKKLDSIDKHLLPSQSEIVETRIKLMINKEYDNKTRQILQNDYIQLLN